MSRRVDREHVVPLPAWLSVASAKHDEAFLWCALGVAALVVRPSCSRVWLQPGRSEIARDICRDVRSYFCNGPQWPGCSPAVRRSRPFLISKCERVQKYVWRYKKFSFQNANACIVHACTVHARVRGARRRCAPGSPLRCLRTATPALASLRLAHEHTRPPRTRHARSTRARASPATPMLSHGNTRLHVKSWM